MPLPFHPIAQTLSRLPRPAPLVDASALQPFLRKLELGEVVGGVMLTINHYSAPDFQSWWSVISISAVFPLEIHWLVASAWRDSGWRTGVTRWLFPRGAKILGFTAMPPMPPDPAETEQRARAVREVVGYCQSVPLPVIGIAPEGSDHPGGVLGELPPGVGRFMLLLSQSCPHIIPVGVWKERGTIRLHFGRPYQLEVEPGVSPRERDVQVGKTVMGKIAQLLPERLQGNYYNIPLELS
jgi:hypothetical protein